MRIVTMSDTHCIHDKMRYSVPEGDVLVHAGDFTSTGTEEQIADFVDWFKKFPHKHKIVICGNHELKFSNNTEAVRKFFPRSIELLHDRSIEIGGLKFFGQPRTPRYFDWGWMYERGLEAEEVWSRVPKDTDVLVCHGPPFMHGDVCPDYNDFWTNSLKHVGCPEQEKRLRDLNVKYVICGHIHHSFGVHQMENKAQTKIVNTSICTEAYRADNPCFVIDTEEDSIRMHMTLNKERKI
jgi:Icc-related predicted phosphoesterase